ncbi:MAG: ABC transporter ATP-binding protein [Kiritimatiellae bacterium]|nr:ABC transporter ATP-binding protein [Kiritimatiellia bacterium]
MPPLLEVHSLARRFSRRDALTHVSFRVDPGEIVALLGPNGSGKTTLLRILAGALAPSDGIVRVAGHDADRAPIALRRSVGYLPDRPGLPPEMRVRDYLLYRGALKGLRGPRLRAQVRVALQQCGLVDLASRRIGALSHGYQRRLGFADALLADPDVLLLDEPHSGLDWPAVQILRDWILAIAQTRAVVFSTHNLPEAALLSTRALVLSAGRLAGDLPLASGRTPDGTPLADAYARLVPA